MKDEIKEILDRMQELVKHKYDKEIHTYNLFDDIQDLLDHINNLQEYKTTIEMEYEREYAKRYLEERRKEQPNLLYPDSDEIYKRYYELKEENERLKKQITEYQDEIFARDNNWYDMQD